MNILSDTVYMASLVKRLLDGDVPVYPVAARMGAARPFCVVRRASYTPEQTKDGACSAAFEVAVATEGHLQGLELAEKVRSRLHGYCAQWEGRWAQAELANASERWASPDYVQTLTFLIELD